MSYQALLHVLKGSASSGNFGHSGRPGKRGGSSAGTGGLLSKANKLLSHMSSVDEPIRYLTNMGIRNITEVGMHKNTGGRVYKLGLGSDVFGELYLDHDKYGDPKYTLQPISKRDIYFTQ